jgi:hypothetical protein
MSSGTELTAATFGQQVHLILILVILSHGGCSKDKVYSRNPRMEEPKKKSVRKFQILLQRNFRWQIKTSSTGARNVYMQKDSIFNISCNL